MEGRAGRLRARVVAALCCGALLTGCGDGARAGRPSVLLLTLDTTRADALSVYDPRKARTPALDALAGESVLFEQAVSAAPYTGPSHASILTGLYPPQHGLRDFLNQAMSPDVESLAEILSDAGYQTAAFLSSYVLDARYGLDQGFDLYSCDFGEAKGSAAELVPLLQRSADEIVDDALDWVDSAQRDRPFLLWLHFYDPHGPREPPAAFRRPDPPGPELSKLERVRRLYYDEVSYLDSQIGRLLDALMERDLYRELVVAVVSDHGELLGEFGRTFGSHSNSLYDATLHVPMIVRIPAAWRAGGVVRDQVRTIDLFPTLLEAASLTPPSGTEGRSLYPLVAGEDDSPRGAYSETFYALPDRAAEGDQQMSLRSGGWKLIAGPRRESLYDLRRDRYEREDRSGVQRQKVTELRAQLDSLAARFPEKSRSRALELGEDEMEAHRERLRALGYLE